MKSAIPTSILLAVLATTACTNTNPYYDSSRPHHTAEGFRNNYPPNPVYQRPRTGFVEGWVTRIKNWTSSSDSREPTAPIPGIKPDLAYIHSNRSDPALTWVGHATFLYQTGTGKNILTDPVFDERASPVSFAGPKRHQPPGLALNDLPHIDVILISHSHYDHLSVDSLRALYRQRGGPPLFIAPLGVDIWLEKNITGGDRSRIVKMDWWDKRSAEGVEVQFLPVHHWSSRTPWDRDATLWGAFALQTAKASFFFSGDLGYSKDISDIAAQFEGFDLAAIGIGAYQPIWYRNSHVSPDEAVRIHRELKIKRSVGMHWGTFPMGQERLDQAPIDLAKARSDQGVPNDEFIVLRHGETFIPVSNTRRHGEQKGLAQ